MGAVFPGEKSACRRLEARMSTPFIIEPFAAGKKWSRSGLGDHRSTHSEKIPDDCEGP
jgi:hypothetical protein